ncbi:hypothetical protein OAS39_10615 [Pirellulales bacterium]|nr:hypothetical protein [Pirellulales bacterium]
MTRLLILSGVFLLTSSGGCNDTPTAAPPPSDEGSTASPDTSQAARSPKNDEQRISDVHKIATLVERFKEAAGHYPYEEAFLNPEPGFVAVPASVNITRLELPDQYRYPPPGVSGAVFGYQDFQDYLREVLGDDVVLPSDTEPPPRFYQYHFDGQNYFVSAVLTSATPDTREVAPGWHKYQVGSTAVPDQKVLRFSDIQ